MSANPPDPRAARGLAGEVAAAALLRRAGLRVVATRWRCALGEIDVVAEEGGVLVFVEVKSRGRTGRYGGPADAVTHRKRRHLARAALSYLTAHDLLDRPCRFDVIEVLYRGSVVIAIRHIPDAFRP